MKKNWLAQAEVNTVRNGARRRGAVWARRFRRRPLVPDTAFQDDGEPYPGHWRQFPELWLPGGPGHRAATQAAVDELPQTWGQVVYRRDVLGHDEFDVASELGLSVEQVRGILTGARSAVRDRVDVQRSRGTRR